MLRWQMSYISFSSSKCWPFFARRRKAIAPLRSVRVVQVGVKRFLSAGMHPIHPSRLPKQHDSPAPSPRLRDVGRQPRRALQPRSGNSTRCCAFRRNELVPVAQGRGVQRAVLAFLGAHRLSTESKSCGFPFASSAIARNRHPRVPLVNASACRAARSAIAARRRRAARRAKTPLPARQHPQTAFAADGGHGDPPLHKLI